MQAILHLLPYQTWGRPDLQRHYLPIFDCFRGPRLHTVEGLEMHLVGTGIKGCDQLALGCKLFNVQVLHYSQLYDAYMGLDEP